MTDKDDNDNQVSSLAQYWMMQFQKQGIKQEVKTDFGAFANFLVDEFTNQDQFEF